jgi:hypothetical protein
MQASSWLAVFKRLPQEQHDKLTLVTSVGIEVALQQIVRLEREFMVVRGRLTGTTDTGIVIMLPYDQIAYMSFSKKLADEEVNEIFKNLRISHASQPASANAGSQSAGSGSEEALHPVAMAVRKGGSGGPEGRDGLPSAADAQGKPGGKGKQLSKTMMLARLRARLAAEKGPEPD